LKKCRFQLLSIYRVYWSWNTI